MIDLMSLKVGFLLDLKIFFRSDGKKSRIKYNSFCFSPVKITSRKVIILGCSKTLSRIISLSILSDSCLFSRNLLIFLIATFLPVTKSTPDITTDDTPLPRMLLRSISYRPTSTLSFSFFLIAYCFISFFSLRLGFFIEKNIKSQIIRYKLIEKEELES